MTETENSGVTIIRDNGARCSACGEWSDKCYRCTECGSGLVGDGKGTFSGGAMT